MRREREVGKALEQLHLDHERPLHATCHRWRAAILAAPRSWDDGLDGAALCHNLFGACAGEAHGAACAVSMRPTSRCRGRGEVQFVDHACCHRCRSRNAAEATDRERVYLESLV